MIWCNWYLRQLIKAYFRTWSDGDEALRLGAIFVLREWGLCLPGGFSEFALDHCQKRNHLQLLKWMYVNVPNAKSRYVIDRAAFWGQLDVIIWFHENKPDQGCTHWAMEGASYNGHLDIIQWLQANAANLVAGYSTESMRFLAEQRGHVHVSKWLRDM